MAGLVDLCNWMIFILEIIISISPFLQYTKGPLTLK